MLQVVFGLDDDVDVDIVALVERWTYAQNMFLLKTMHPSTKLKIQHFFCCQNKKVDTMFNKMIAKRYFICHQKLNMSFFILFHIYSIARKNILAFLLLTMFASTFTKCNSILMHKDLYHPFVSNFMK